MKSKRQSEKVRSSTKTDVQGPAHMICEMQMEILLTRDENFFTGKPMTMFCDKWAATMIASNVSYYKAHIEVDCYLMKDMIIKKNMTSYFNLKIHVTSRCSHLSSGVTYIYYLAWGGVCEPSRCSSNCYNYLGQGVVQ